MAGNKAAIKSRIKSINTTKKITGAMELISTVKLQKNRSVMEKTITYAEAIENTVEQLLSGDNVLKSPYLEENETERKLYFVFTSDMGLCGGYNLNVNKLIFDEIDKDDCIILIGTKLYPILKRSGYNIINDPCSADKSDYRDIKDYADIAIRMFEDKEISSINVIYTRFVNNVSFKPLIKKVLPCELVRREEEDRPYKEILFEPSPEAILNSLIPIMIENDIYRLFMESKTSEHGSRRYAMENATNNANDLNDKLLLAYNQARQAAITSEITEIVAGADAL
ncbi:MAG: ATP synthase F1 subunit gamma [Erysipelotrichaceae bacterium]|nr:ATP synthase F1 subunit gamma [Erysipelotrichaceae bacterium]